MSVHAFSHKVGVFWLKVQNSQVWPTRRARGSTVHLLFVCLRMQSLKTRRRRRDPRNVEGSSAGAPLMEALAVG